MIFEDYFESPVGGLRIRCTDRAVKSVTLGCPFFVSPETNPLLEQTKSWFRAYFAGDRPSPFALPLEPDGNEFRLTVWKILCRIPYGTVVSYGDVAEETARCLKKERMSAQAAGGAIGHNPIGIVIPCHRVVGADGSLTGYNGGLDRKIRLLQLEGISIPLKKSMIQVMKWSSAHYSRMPG